MGQKVTRSIDIAIEGEKFSNIYSDSFYFENQNITVSDRKSYCLGHTSIFQAQVINNGDDLSDTNEIRDRSNRLGPQTARRNLIYLLLITCKII